MDIKIPKILIIFNEISSCRIGIICFLSLFFVFSLTLSICKQDFNWLAAFGGVATIFGVLLVVSHSVPKTEHEINSYIEKLFPESTDGRMGEYYEGQEENEPKLKLKREKEALRVLKSEALGLIITVLGTILWAYSGFLTELFWPNA